MHRINKTLVLFVLFSGVCIADLLDPNGVPNSISLASRISNSPRYTINGQKISAQFCAPDSDGNCNFMNYAQGLAVFAIPGGLFAALSFLSFFIFLMGRFCCNLFGGRARSPGCCVPGPKDHWRGYGKRSIWAVKIILYLCMLGLGLAVVFGFIGNAQINAGIDSTLTTVTTLAETLSARLEGIAAFQHTYTPNSTDTSLQAYQEMLSGFTAPLADYQAKVVEYNKDRSIAEIISVCLPCALLFIGAVASILNWKSVSMFGGLVCFLCSLVIWLSFGIHLTVSVALIDVCTYLETGISEAYTSNSNDTNPIFAQILECASGGSLGGMVTALEEQFHTNGAQLCGGYQQICAGTGSQCSQCTFAGLAAFPSTNRINDKLMGCIGSTDCPYTGGNCPSASEIVCYNVSRTIANCSTDCRNTDLKTSTATLVTGTYQLVGFYQLAHAKLYPLLNCSYVTDSINGIYDGVCGTLQTGTDRIAIASAFIGVLLIPGTILLIMGFKRFRNSSINSSRIVPFNGDVEMQRRDERRDERDDRRDRDRDRDYDRRDDRDDRRDRDRDYDRRDDRRSNGRGYQGFRDERY